MSTILATREAPEDTLLDLAYARCETFLRYGTTTIEGKTGYGQTRDSELKSLRVLNQWCAQMGFSFEHRCLRAFERFAADQIADD